MHSLVLILFLITNLWAEELVPNVDSTASIKLSQGRLSLESQIKESAKDCLFDILSLQGQVSIRRVLGVYPIDFKAQKTDKLCLADLINVQNGSITVRLGSTELSVQKKSQVTISQIVWEQKSRLLINLSYGTARIWSTQSNIENLNFDQTALLVSTSNSLFIAYNAETMLTVPFESITTAVTVLRGNLFLRPLQIKENLASIFGTLDKSNWLHYTEGASLKVITEKNESDLLGRTVIKYFTELDHYSIQQILNQLYAQGFIPYHRFFQGLSLCASVSLGDINGKVLPNTPAGFFSSGFDYQPYGLGLRYGFKEGSFLRFLAKFQPVSSGQGSSLLHIEPLLELGTMRGRFSAGFAIGSGLLFSDKNTVLRPTASLFGNVALNIFGDAFLDLGPRFGAYLANEKAGFSGIYYYAIDIILNWKM